MLDQLNYTTYLSGDFPYLDLKKKIFSIMGQLLEYLASVFTIGSTTGSSEKSSNSNSNSNNNNSDHHVTFADSSFSHAFGRGNQDQATKLAALRQSNRKTIYTYEFIVIISTLIHFSIALWPRLQLDTFDLMEPEGWQFVTLNMMPFFVQAIAICAMADLNKPIPDGAKLSSKNAKLTLDNNEFIHSLKVIVCLMAICQVLAIYSDLLLWLVVLILPLWCYKLTSRLASAEFDRHAPSPRKSWVKLNVPKSPKLSTPSKLAPKLQSSKADDANRATPRTRTKKAVKNFFTNVTDKYHTFEQNVAHTISQRMNSPLGPGTKMISYDNGSR